MKAAAGAEIRSVVVDYADGRYRLESVTEFHAPAEAVFAVLTDYDRFDRITSAYREARFLGPADDGGRLIYTRVEGCVWFFCKTIERVERLVTEPHRWIETHTIPERSDLDYGYARWEFQPIAAGVSVRYVMEMKPSFWVPPVIGPILIKRKLARDGAEAVQRIERLALERAREGA
jgi:hypothetical protein